MPKFRIGDSKLIHDGKEHEPGSVAELPEEIGEKLGLKLTSDARPKGPEDPAVRLAAIKEAIGILEKGNEEHFTKDGSPRVEAIEVALGYGIKAEERNQAWMDMQAEGEKGNE